MARQGGDEFVVMLSRLRQRSDAATVASKMVEQLTEPFVLNGHTVRASASVGVVLYEGGDEDVETLLRHADLAMYQAKSAGRNAWAFFEPAMDQSIAQRLLVESDLRRAIRDNQLVLHYQPQVNCHTGVVTGVEALVRWQHPQRGLLMPDSFVAQAECSGLIDDLGSWVMREAFKQWRVWASQGIDGLTMAVNVSAMEFGRASFITRLRRALDDTEADPDWIELEITESALMQSLPELVERLGDIARMGVRLALDDFGTGYSSLGYLKRLPLNSLKIDKSFVRDLPGDKEDEAIVCATLSMAKALELKVVAEGVELTGQRAFLADLGCDEIQGWLVARPMPAEAFEAWWRQRQAHKTV
jgi:predicted signal transduction protein with EAL and GGDEF domain